MTTTKETRKNVFQSKTQDLLHKPITVEFAIFYAIYIGINSLFVIKYSARLPEVNTFLIWTAYTLLATLLFVGIMKLTANDIFLKYAFFAVLFGYFAFTIFVNYTVDGNTVNVDRWSAMQVAIESLFSGNYPYSAIDHLGGRTSNLPALIFIGIPFYLIGNIGLLQSFTFLLFGATVFFSFKSFKIRLLVLLAMTFSPALLWEVYVKSDLLSNFILLLSFGFFLQKKLSDSIKSPATAIFAAFLLLTRLTSFIPLSLLLFKNFYNSATSLKIKFIAFSLLTILISGALVFYNVGSIENLINYNPFALQNRQLPIYISILSLILPLFLSFKINTTFDFVKWSSILIFIPVIIAFIIKAFKTSLFDCVFDSRFDISYFNMALPFLIFCLGLNIQKNE